MNENEITLQLPYRYDIFLGGMINSTFKVECLTFLPREFGISLYDPYSNDWNPLQAPIDDIQIKSQCLFELYYINPKLGHANISRFELGLRTAINPAMTIIVFEHSSFNNIEQEFELNSLFYMATMLASKGGHILYIQDSITHVLVQIGDIVTKTKWNICNNLTLLEDYYHKYQQRRNNRQYGA